MAGTWMTLPSGERIQRHTPAGQRVAVDGGPRCAGLLWGEYRCRRTPHSPQELHMFDVRPAANNPEVLPVAATLAEILARRATALAELAEIDARLAQLAPLRQAFTQASEAYRTLANLDTSVVDGATVALSNQPATEAPCEE